MANDDFAGKAALITGSTSGIGLAIAEEFTRRGLQVVVSGVDLAEAERAASRIGAASAVALDVREEASWVAALDVVEAPRPPAPRPPTGPALPPVALPSLEALFD